LLAVDAPDPVVDAFIDVLAAQQEKETLRNQALKYRDGIIPVAQGQVEKVVKEAEGYKQAVVSKATGDAARFTSVYNAYVQAKDVTRRRMYLETMAEIYSGMNKVVMDSKGGAMPYFPLNDFKAKTAQKPVEPKKEEKAE
jgi:membrane protease subunit HflK